MFEDLQLKIDESKVFRQVLSGCFDDIANEMNLDSQCDDAEDLSEDAGTPVIRSLVQMHCLPYQSENYSSDQESDGVSNECGVDYEANITTIRSPINVGLFGDQMDIESDGVRNELVDKSNITTIRSPINVSFSDQAHLQNESTDIMSDDVKPMLPTALDLHNHETVEVRFYRLVLHKRFLTKLSMHLGVLFHCRYMQAVHLGVLFL